jgi:uncharacterized membrane protein
MPRSALVKRSVVKAVTYRLVIMVFDFATIYFFTKTLKVAFGFMIASNLYTTFAYYGHERLWARIKWGLAG